MGILLLIVAFCSVFILVGGGLMIHAGRKVWLGVKARHWPLATGRMLEVRSKDTSDSDSTSREIQVRYSYNVDGATFQGSTIHPCYSSSSVEELNTSLESLLKSGQQVRVHYNPAAPHQCTLSTGFYSGTLTLVFGGWIFFSAGLGFLLTFWFGLAGDWDLGRGITVLPERLE